LNFDKAGLKKAAEELRPSADGQKVHPLEGVMFASTDYPFRSGVKKIIVLAKCSACDGFSIDYYDIQNKLLGAGITLHIVGEEQIELRDDRDHDHIGMDARSVYTLNDVDEEPPSRPDERRAVVQPHDTCSILAQESNGLVFYGGALIEAETSQQFSTVLAQRISEHSVKPTCSVCECQSHHDVASTVCYPCTVPQPVSLLASNTFFNIHYIKPFRKLKQAAQRLAETEWLP